MECVQQHSKMLISWKKTSAHLLSTPNNILRPRSLRHLFTAMWSLQNASPKPTNNAFIMHKGSRCTGAPPPAGSPLCHALPCHTNVLPLFHCHLEHPRWEHVGVPSLHSVEQMAHRLEPLCTWHSILCSTYSNNCWIVILLSYLCWLVTECNTFQHIPRVNQAVHFNIPLGNNTVKSMLPSAWSN